jgi:hypothetical protein
MQEKLTSSNDNVELLEGIWEQFINCCHGDVEEAEKLDSKEHVAAVKR